MTNKLVYARAQPEFVSLKETYRYKLEIARNQAPPRIHSPEGQLEIAVPYDGQRYFSRLACADVEHQLGSTNPAVDVDAQVGHVLFNAYGRTDLKRVLDLGSHYDTLPIRVPVVCDLIHQPAHLYDDQHAALIRHTYRPEPPEVLPISVSLQVMDEKSFDPLPGQPLGAGPTEWSELLRRLKRHLNFQPDLILALSIHLDLPESAPAHVAPRIARAVFDWPTLTSLRTIELVVGAARPAVQYNPARPGIEWAEIKLAPVERARAGVKSFASPPIWLRIGQPGELYRQAELTGTIELVIDGLLFSGTQLRVYDGVGAQITSFAPTLSTELQVDLSLRLDDAFARRTLVPYQSLVFDEVIPDELRMADIYVALRDHGFQIVHEQSYTDGDDVLRHTMQAQRPAGPDTLELWVIVDGERYATERQAELPGGQIYTSTFTSGELRLHMIGKLQGNPRELTRTMNAIQADLCDRFARLRAKR